jgi:hypothetical protein
MSRTRIILTLVLVAVVAMLLGLGLSTLLVRRLGAPARLSQPEATEPQRPARPMHEIADV